MRAISMLGQASQREGDGVGLGLGHVDAVAAQARADLLLLDGQGLRAGAGVEPRVEDGAGRLGDDPQSLRGVHQAVSTRGGPASRTAGSSSK
jgi:hypothetical protein